MTSAEKYHFADFTRDNYRRLIKLAKKKYTFCNFENYKGKDNFILWRHDIDFSVHSAYALAKIEASEKVQSTFFVHLHNDFYNVLEKEIVDLLKKILKLGHKAGLHFDCHYYNIKSEKGLEKKLEFEKDLLQQALRTDIDVFSYHNPTKEILAYDKDTYAGMINTYNKFFRGEIGYCSDSNGYWRFDRLEDILTSGKYENLQVLTHPAWWQKEVLSPQERIWRSIEGRAAKTKKKYLEVLNTMGRENVNR